MSTLERAIAIAAEAHAGQTDKAGQPYILHPLRVMIRLADPQERIVAVLHDVVEDCPEWPLSRLADEGFGPPIIEAIDALTRRKGEEYVAYLKRTCGTEASLVVKIADLRDNIDPGRPGTYNLPTSLLNRYKEALGRIVYSDEGQILNTKRVLP